MTTEVGRRSILMTGPCPHEGHHQTEGLRPTTGKLSPKKKPSSLFSTRLPGSSSLLQGGNCDRLGSFSGRSSSGSVPVMLSTTFNVCFLSFLTCQKSPFLVIIFVDEVNICLIFGCLKVIVLICGLSGHNFPVFSFKKCRNFGFKGESIDFWSFRSKFSSFQVAKLSKLFSFWVKIVGILVLKVKVLTFGLSAQHFPDFTLKSCRNCLVFGFKNVRILVFKGESIDFWSFRSKFSSFQVKK